MDHSGRAGKAEETRAETTASAPNSDANGATDPEEGCSCGACGGNRAVKYHFYTFCSKNFTPIEGQPHRFHVPSFSTLARSPENAFEMFKKRSSDLFTWYVGVPNDPTWMCNMCSGAWHPATGHYDLSLNRMWCGRCTRDMVKFLKTMLPRTWGGLKFYEHAVLPTSFWKAQVEEKPLATPQGLQDLDGTR
jgi:hypothetical protein